MTNDAIFLTKHPRIYEHLVPKWENSIIYDCVTYVQIDGKSYYELRCTREIVDRSVA